MGCFTHVYVLFGGMSIQICLFFDWVVWFFAFVGFTVGGVLICVSCMHVFEINLLLVILFANILSYSVGFIFVCLLLLFPFLISFTVQKLLSLLRSRFFVCFYLHQPRRQIQKNFAMISIKQCSAYVSPRSFIVSDRAFRCLIYFCIQCQSIF